MLRGEAAMKHAAECALDSTVGQEYRLGGLQSARGQELNGQLCLVLKRKTSPQTESATGESNRLVVRLLSGPDKNKILSVQYRNLVSPSITTRSSYNLASSPDASSASEQSTSGANEAGASSQPQATIHHPSPIPNSKLRKFLKAALRHHEGGAKGGPDDRLDMTARKKLIRKWLRSEEPIRTNIRCMDSICPPNSNKFLQMMEQMKPPCVGDGIADFRRFNEGLVGDGSDCAICLTTIERDSLEITNFPCMHIFHKRCGDSWLRSHNTCPTCRLQLPISGQMFLAEEQLESSRKEKISVRFNEWVISGMCQRCQAAYMERDPLMAVPSGDPGQPSMLVPQSQLYGSGY